MNRTPSADVLRQLRQEVGFGCPFPECREAILTWHHFDPPWHKEQHHRPEGMIALCRQHAAAADRGLYPDSQLRQMKRSAPSLEGVKARLPWATRDFLIRLGGCYSGGESVPLLVGGNPIIVLSRDSNGLLVLSVELRAPDGAPLASIRENMFEADPAQMHDLKMDTAPTKVKIWFAERNIGMELSFRRIALQDLDAVLAIDRQRANDAIEVLMPLEIANLLAKHGPERRRNMEAMLSGSTLPPEIRDAALSDDPTGTLVRAYAKRQVDDEGKVAFLDFKKLHVHSNGIELIVGDGLESGGGFFMYCGSFSNGRGGFNL